jgi:hypothetical protein
MTNRRFIGVTLPFVAFFVAFFCGATTASASGLVKAPNNLGLMSYWSFEEGAGTKATDFSGNGNTGILTNGPTWVGGKRGKALSFASSSFQYVDISDNAALTPASITVSAWVKPTALPASSGDIIAIIAKRDGGGTGGYILELYNNSGNQQIYWLAAGGTNPLNFNNTLPVGVWSHIVITQSGTAGEMYLNGVSLGTATVDAIANVAVNLKIGARADGKYFDGSIDEVRIYNRALSATEVAALYNSGAAALNRSIIGPAAGNLISWHTFDGSKLNSTTSTDSSSGGHNGTLSGGPTVARGKTGQALSFDGSNDYVNLGAPAINYASTDWTVSAWVKFNTLGTQASIFGYGNGDTGNSRYWQVRKLSNNTLQFAHYNGAGNDLAAGTATLDTNWHFILVKQVSTTRTVYVDGVSDITQTSAISVPNTVQDDTRIGYPIWASGSDNYFPGIIDDFRIYNRALSTTEIAQLYGVRGVTVNKSVVGGPGTNGLVLWHTFDGPKLNTTTSTDSVSTTNNGTLSGSPTPTRGKIGQALSFNRSNHISIPSFSPTAFPVTISGWIYTTDGTLYNKDIVSFGASGSNNDFFLVRLDANGNNTNSYTIGSKSTVSGVRSTTGGSLSTNAWHNIVAIFDSTSQSVYVDGTFTASTTATITFPAGVDNGCIGAFSSFGGCTDTALGTIDDVRVYNRALSAAEVLQLYNAGK